MAASKNGTARWFGGGPRVPGPTPSHWLFGDIKLFAVDPTEYLLKATREYGPLVRLPMPGRSLNHLYLINDAHLVHEVLVSQAHSFIKDPRGVDVMARTLGRGLITSEGDLHKRQRKLLQPAFQSRRIETYGPVIVAQCQRMLASWQGTGRQIVDREMHHLTMDIAVKALFDADLSQRDHDVAKAVSRLQQLAIKEMLSVVAPPRWWPSADNRELKRERAQLQAVVQGIIDRHRQAGVDRGDLLSALLHSAEGGEMSNQQLRDELVTLFAAGHETTANAMTWTWALLSENPSVEAQLHRELDAVLAGRAPSVEDLPSLPYTEAVFKESLRLRPPVWMLNARRSKHQTTLGGYRIPGNSLFFISPYTLHRNEQHFSEAEAFLPERWLQARAEKIPRLAYLPFGAGHRVCIGNQFSMQEGVLLIATIAQRYQLRLEGAAPELSARITLGPSDAMAMRLRARPGPADR